MMISRNNTSEVRFDPLHDRLQVHCSRSFDSAGFRSSLLEALTFAKAHYVKHWLLDLREIGELSEEDETWVYAQLFPEMMMTLGEENYLAVLIPEPCYQHLLKESGAEGLTSYNSFIIIHNFYEPEKAHAWLNRRSPHAA
ncbi:hypothetical protein I2I11_15400 [Pontibacter sp. 172403-2]|uniref:hypothetical protein n=1 Tax=Pontibacter rufus TaxID=2791028 RepID=UPI0018AFDB74|nr:hypothetical protein [Pontibacter sp. 172403-2]MBF9254690.1 hypothetical protein [Pontibacter sp. 172403-2]